MGTSSPMTQSVQAYGLSQMDGASATGVGHECTWGVVPGVHTCFFHSQLHDQESKQRAWSRTLPIITEPSCLPNPGH